MCSRFALYKSKNEIIEELIPLLWEEGFDYASNWNVTPTTTVPVLLSRGDQRVMTGMHWGLFPAWQNRSRQPLINARVETVAEKPSFRNLMGTNQCAIIMNGYFEWKKDGNVRRPYFITRPDGNLLFAAGLWQDGSNSSRGIPQVTMVTREPTQQLVKIHNRMPYLLAREALEEWCKGARPQETKASLEFDLETTAVTPKVNSVHASGPDCIEPAEEQMELF